MASEFDQHMKLQRGMSPGQSFAQMMQSMKNGLGQGMEGMGGTAGSGPSGFGMGSPNPGSSFDMLGSEPAPSGNADGPRSGDGEGQGNPKQTIKDLASAEDQGEAGEREANIIESAAVRSDTLIEQYRGITDAYFDRLTTRRSGEREKAENKDKERAE